MRTWEIKIGTSLLRGSKNISTYEIIKKYGADILRIWVASSNYNEDLKISFESLDRLSDSYRKIRNTIRFILGNMNGLCWEGKFYFFLLK